MAAFSGDGDGVSLNLLPMLDIFSIIITFLLMSFSADPVNYDIKGLELPDSATMVALDELPTIKVTTTEIMILDKKVAEIVDGDVLPQYQDQGAVRPVFDELEKIRVAKEARRLSGTGDDLDKASSNSVGMEMDKAHNFKLMKRVMLAAQQAEFITFKLLVNKQTN